MNCIDEEKLNNFLEKRETPMEREKIEAHLAVCGKCRLLLTGLYAEKTQEEIFHAPQTLKEKAKKLPQKEKAAPKFFSFLSVRQIAFAFASLIIIFSLVGFFVFRENETISKNDDIFRQGEKSANLPQAVLPENNANLSGEEIEFRWSGIDQAISYNVIISDEKGDIYFEKTTKDKNLTVKVSDADLTPGKYYFWHVRAKNANGEIKETEPRKFVYKGR